MKMQLRRKNSPFFRSITKEGDFIKRGEQVSQKGGKKMNYIWILIFLILGIFMAVKPELLWKIEHFFSVKDGKPSEIYLAITRISGVIFVFLAFCFTLGHLL